MSSPFGTMLLIANPTAGRGRGNVLTRLQDALRARGLDNEAVVTRGPGHASELAREAVTDRDLRYIVAVGGDGTVHEVVNGLFDPETGTPHRDDVVFGAVPAGTGCDFLRTFGLDRSPEKLAGHFEGETVFPVDLGRVRLRDRDGRETVHLFANIAEVGYGAVVTDKANHLPKSLGKLRYLLAIFSVLRSFERVPSEIDVSHTTVNDDVSMLVVANGQFFGGNMKVAPRALPDDGRFNVQIWRGKPSDAFTMTPKIRKGEHLPHPDIREYQSATVRIAPATPMLVEADGEVLGTTPATFDLIDKALRLKI